MAWADLLPELHGLIRERLVDGWWGNRSLHRAMLSFTCKAEYALRHPDDASPAFTWFEDACRLGYLSIVQWLLPGVRPREYLSYQGALFWGHFHVAEWCDQQGLRPVWDGGQHLALNGKLNALKWLVAHDHVLDTDLLEPARSNMELVRWLVEEQHQVPTQ